MHPEIRRDKPGTCPKCGMALEPELPSIEDEENPELVIAALAMSLSSASLITNALRLRASKASS